MNSSRYSEIQLHADDYGLSAHTSAQILECCQKGLLDGISILPNFSCFDKDMALLQEKKAEFPRQVTCSVHLNLMEGPCVAEAGKIPNLVNGEGFLNRSWGSLFLASFLPGRSSLQKQLETEIAAQIKKVMAVLGDTSLYIDGHQHTQMIPLVFDALCAVIRQEGYSVSYIRNSAEPLLPFLMKVSLWKSFRPVNFVKNLILNLCAWYAEPKMRKFGCRPMKLWGLVMSGHMDAARIEKLMPDMKKTAEKKGCQLEILFHPGTLSEHEITPEYSSAEALAFYLSEGRSIEYAALEKKEIWIK